MNIKPLVVFGIALAFSGVPTTALWAERAIGPSKPVPQEAAGNALSPVGVWNKTEGATKFEIFECGSSYCGKIVYLRNPIDPDTGKPLNDKFNPDTSKRNHPLIGTHVLLNMAAAGPNRYKGKVYDPESGKIYSGTLSQSNANSIKLGGCIFGGLICKTDTLIRVR